MKRSNPHVQVFETGELRWHKDLLGWAIASPSVTDSGVYVVTSSGVIDRSASAATPAASFLQTGDPFVSSPWTTSPVIYLMGHSLSSQ